MQAAASFKGTAVAAKPQQRRAGRGALRVSAAKTESGPKLVVAGIT